MYDLQVTSSDALPLSYSRLGAKAIKLGALTISQNWPARENWFSLAEMVRKKASPRDPARGFYVDYAQGQMKTIWRM